MRGREFEPHQLPNELFYVWLMNPEDPGPTMSQRGGFWGVGTLPFLLKSMVDRLCRYVQISIGYQ